jgi:hypothetical protein
MQALPIKGVGLSVAGPKTGVFGWQQPNEQKFIKLYTTPIMPIQRNNHLLQRKRNYTV